MAKPRVLILRAPGSNCDNEAAFAFQTAGALPDRIHINAVRERPSLLKEFQILVIPGGFTYGDDVAAGKILANQLAYFLEEPLQQFRSAGKLILGICNGFQVLLKAGMILPPDASGPVATLAHNESGVFGDRWIHLQVDPGNCPFLQGLARLYLPVAHGEGRFLARSEDLLRNWEGAGQIVLRYCDASGQPGGFPVNPNGSEGHVAGVCDRSGHVFGLMPHPERHVLPLQHPRWTREGLATEGEGLAIFRNATRFFE